MAKNKNPNFQPGHLLKHRGRRLKKWLDDPSQPQLFEQPKMTPDPPDENKRKNSPPFFLCEMCKKEIEYELDEKASSPNDEIYRCPNCIADGFPSYIRIQYWRV